MSGEHALPIFRLAVNILIRFYLLGQRRFCVLVDAKHMGIPGTKYGLRSQMRKLISGRNDINLDIINDIYRTRLPQFMQVELDVR